MMNQIQYRIFNLALATATLLACGAEVGGDPEPSSPFQTIGVSRKRTGCAARADGTTECWGRTDNVPPENAYFEYLDGGDGYMCGVATSNVISCWVTSNNQALQADITPPPGRFLNFSSGFAHTCATAAENNTTVCWGSASEAVLTPPADVEFQQLSAGLDFTCGIRADNDNIICWGDVPVEPDQSAYVRVESGEDSICALNSDGNLKCWGPVTDWFDGTGVFTDFSVGDDHVCAIDTERKLHCWVREGSTIQVDSVQEFLEIRSGTDFVCGLTSTHGIICFGDNFYGVLDTPPA